MTKFLSKMSASVLLTMVFIVGGLLLSAGEANAQSSIVTPTPIVKPANGWVSAQTAATLVNQQLNTLEIYLIQTNPNAPAFKLTKMKHELYEMVSDRLAIGDGTEQAVQGGYQAFLATNPFDVPSTSLTAQQANNIYLEVVDLLTN